MKPGLRHRIGLSIMLGMQVIHSHIACGAEFTFDTEADFTDNFTPNSGIRWIWADPAGIDGGGLQLDTSTIASQSVFTLSSFLVPMPQEGDQVWASVDFIFDTDEVTNLGNVFSLFFAKQSQGADVFNAAANSYANLQLLGTYGAPIEGYTLVLESAPENYTSRLSSDPIEFPLPSSYRLTLTADLIGVANGEHQLTANLDGPYMPSGGFDVVATETPTNYNIADPFWRVGIRTATNVITAIDNLRVAYVVGGAGSGIRITDFAVEAGGFRIDWYAPPGQAVDIYRTTDFFVWGYPILTASYAGTFLDTPLSTEKAFYVLVPHGETFPEHPILPGVDTSAWSGLTAGSVSYDSATGYQFGALPNGLLYPQVDDSVEGGYRFLDSSGQEVMMEVPVSLNNNYSSPTGYDFRLLDSLLPDTDYELFDPTTLTGPVPDLSGWPPGAPWNGSYWGVAPLPSSPTLGPSTSADCIGGVWDFDAGVDSPYLLLRQPIEVGVGGLIGNPAPVNLTGRAATDVSLFLRRPDASLLPLYEDDTPGGDIFAAVLDPTHLQPGTNYLEVYGSYGVAGPTETPIFLDDFESYSIGAAAGQIDLEKYLLYHYSASDLQIVSANTEDDVPDSFGQVLYNTSNSNNPVVRPYGTGVDIFAIGYPDMEFSCTVGKATTDDDAILIWFQVSAENANGPAIGWYVFLSGGGVGWLGGANVGIAYRPDGLGSDIVVASNLDTPSLATWDASHGFRNNLAGNWNVVIETEGDTFRLSLSDRGDSTTAAGAPAQVLEYVDPDYDLSTILSTRFFGVQAVSQECWFDNFDYRPLSARGGLRIDTGEIAEGGLQSLDGTVSQARYVLQGGQLVDRMGDGTMGSSANPATISTDAENWIDYVPGTTLEVATEAEVIGSP